MKFCPYCGMQNPDEYRFCMSCRRELPPPSYAQQIPQPAPPAQPQQYYQPSPPQAPPVQPIPPAQYYPPRPKRRAGLIIGVIVVVAIVIISVMLWAFVFKEKEGEKGKTMTYGELWSDVEITGMNFTGMTLKSYKDGDVLYIKDKVSFIEYYPTATPQSITLIYFQSGGYLPICLYGDKRAEYPNGSSVTIPVHVKQYTIEGKSVLWLEEWYNYYAASFGPSGGTPTATVIGSVTGGETGKDWVNITWTVAAPSRADILWSDVPQSKAKLTCEGANIWLGTDALPTATTQSVTYDTTGYVTGGDVIRITLIRAGCTAYKAKVVQLTLVYGPSGGTFATASVTLDWTA